MKKILKLRVHYTMLTLYTKQGKLHKNINNTVCTWKKNI